MRILKKNLKNDELTIKIVSNNDLWYLTQIIVPGTIIKGKTLRKIQLNDKEAQRKPVYIEIEAEKIEFMEFSDVLKVLGKIIFSNDSRIGKGDYHSFNLSINDEIIIQKNWSETDFEFIEKSSNKESLIMLVAADYGDALIAYYHDYSIEYSTTLSEELGGKKEITNYEKNKNEFVKTLLSTINELAKARNIKKILIGTAGMMSGFLKSKIDSYDYLKNKTFFSKINYSNKNGIKELIKSENVQKLISQTNYYNQLKLVEELFKLISKSRKSTYGYAFVKKAIQLGAVKDLLFTTNFIKELRQKNKYLEFDKLIKKASELKATINIIPSETEIGEQIDNLKGIAAILRYSIEE